MPVSELELSEARKTTAFATPVLRRVGMAGETDTATAPPWLTVPMKSGRAAAPRMNSLGALAVFVRAAGARNFTEAGRRLGVSSSAVGIVPIRLLAYAPT
jgi:hypothetical protein